MAYNQKTNKKKSKGIVVSVITLLILCVCCVISFVPGMPSWSDISKKASVNNSISTNDNLFYAHFIDVGQADCELIICGDDTILIDAGDVDSYNTVKTYLDLYNVTDIDYFVITHAHSDHIGSADDIINNYKIDNVIMTRLNESNTPTTAVYENLLNALSNCNANIIAATPGSHYALQNFSFDVIAPVKDYIDLNNTSVVIKVQYQNSVFLFDGDAEEKSEKDIMAAGYDVSADVIKLGHHGSNTSSCDEFLEAVNPQIAVISCGKDNKYHHPSEETLLKLNKYNISYFRTDINGNVVISSDGINISVKTDR